MARVRLVVDDEQKGRWKEYVSESTEYDSISDLIRKSVEQEIADSDAQGAPGLEMGQVTEEVDELRKEVVQLQDSLHAHRQDSLEADTVEDIVQNTAIDLHENINMKHMGTRVVVSALLNNDSYLQYADDHDALSEGDRIFFENLTEDYE
mgnify:CR=1 FL=1